MAWFNRFDPKHIAYRITTVGATGGYRLARVKTYRDVLVEYLNHTESKSAGPEGWPCRGPTVGLLRRREVVSMRGLVRHIGKESNDLENRIHHLVTDEGEYLNDYDYPEDDQFWLLVVPVLTDLVASRGLRTVARAAGVAPSTLGDVLSASTSIPRPGLRQNITHAAGEYARESLLSRRIEPSRDDVLCCAIYQAKLGCSEPGLGDGGSSTQAQ